MVVKHKFSLCLVYEKYLVRIIYIYDKLLLNDKGHVIEKQLFILIYEEGIENG